jgi:CRP/FNR family cyclic AMP-dependent transcriptional regulator
MLTHFPYPQCREASYIDNGRLLRIALFEGLSDEELTMVKPFLRFKVVSTKTILLAPRHSRGGVYLLLKGTVKICVEHDEGSPTIVALCGPDEVLGNLDPSDGRENITAVIALEPCQVLWMPTEDFRQVLDLAPQINRNLVGILTHRLRCLTENINARQALRALPDLIARQLLLLARESGIKGIKQPDGSIRIPLRLTQYEIAGLLGCTRESVNHVFTSFRRQGFISFDSKHCITIHNVQALYNRCRECMGPEELVHSLYHNTLCPAQEVSPQWTSPTSKDAVEKYSGRDTIRLQDSCLMPKESEVDTVKRFARKV